MRFRREATAIGCAPRRLAVPLALVLFAALPADADGAGPVRVFELTAAAEAPTDAVPEGGAVPRPIRVDTASLDDVGPGSRLALPLAPRVEHVGVVERVERRGAGRFSWRGRLEGQPDSRFDIVVEGGVMLGNVHPEAGPPYEIRFAGPGIGHTVRAVSSVPDARCGAQPPPRHRMQRSESEGMTEDGARAVSGAATPLAIESGDFVDVLFLYDAANEAAAGGTAGLHAAVQLALDTTNTAYADSDVAHRLRLAGRRSIEPAADAYSYGDVLIDLTLTDDGDMDEVHGWRDAYGADLVVYLVDPYDGGASDDGAAWWLGDGAGTLGPDAADFAFAVTHVNLAAAPGTWSVAHQIGHLLGSAHQQPLGGAGSGGITGYAYGWRFQGDSGTFWRTIMADEPIYQIGDPIVYRIPRFSNPAQQFDGQPLGFPIGTLFQSDNHSAFALADDLAANFRQALPDEVWVDFAHTGPFLGTQADPFADLASAEAAVRWGGTIHLTPGTTADGAVGTLGATRAYRLVTTAPGNATLD